MQLYRTIQINRLCWLFLSLTVFFIATFPKPALAHPHIFVDSVMDIEFGPKGMTAVKLKWVFDDLSSSQYVMDLDTNGDGKLTKQEWAKQRSDIASFLGEESFFLHVLVDGEKRLLSSTTHFEATYEAGILTYSFVLPLSIPRGTKEHSVQIALYDPSYYSDFYIPADDYRLKGQVAGVELEVADAPELVFYNGQVVPVAARLKF